MNLPVRDSTGLILRVEVETHPTDTPGLVVHRELAWNAEQDWHESGWWAITHEASGIRVDWGHRTRAEATLTAHALRRLRDWTWPMPDDEFERLEIRRRVGELRWELSRKRAS